MGAILLPGELQVPILYREMGEEQMKVIAPVVQLMMAFLRRKGWKNPKPEAIPFKELHCTRIILPNDHVPRFAMACLDPSLVDEDFEKLQICNDKGCVALGVSMEHIPILASRVQNNRMILMPPQGCDLKEAQIQRFFQMNIPTCSA